MGSMRKATRLINSTAACVAAVSFATVGCSGALGLALGEGEPSATVSAIATTAASDGMQLETIVMGERELTVPLGLRIPDVEVTHADERYIVMTSPEKKPVVDEVKASAIAAGYEVHAEGSHGLVLIGHGNAVLLAAKSHVQMLTWVPEAMKDVLSE